MTPDKIQVLRTIDKWDKNGPEGTFDLLTNGKVDQSGASIPGCGLGNGQALALVAFTGIMSHPYIADRFMMIEALDKIQTGEWETALDDLKNMKHPNWAWQLDDLIAVCAGRETPPRARDWDCMAFLADTARKASVFNPKLSGMVMTPILIAMRELGA